MSRRDVEYSALLRIHEVEVAFQKREQELKCERREAIDALQAELREQEEKVP